ncbi:MAG: Xaa-Pro peptidase family protein [bacterium]
MNPAQDPYVAGEIRKAQGLTPEVPEAEFRGRLERARSLMKELGYEALLLYGAAAPQPDWIRYFSNYVQPFPIAGSFLFIDAHGRETLLIDCPWNLEDAKSMSTVGDVRAFPHGRYRWQFEEVTKVLKNLFRQAELEGGAVGICALEMPTLYHQAIQAAAPDTELVDAAPLWTRIVSAPSEFDRSMICRTAEIADAGMRTALDACREGAPEYEVCIEALRVMASMGAEFLHGGGPSTHINMGSGSRVVSNVRPFLFTTRKLEAGDMFWLDLSASYAGYYVDFDRTVSIGEPNAKQRRIYDTCREMYDALFAAIRPGAKGKDVFRAGFEVAKAAGYEDTYNLIYLGHMSGITTSERPFIIPEEEMELPEGGYLNIEPGIFEVETGTSSLEDIILVGPEGGEAVTRCDLGLHVA